MNFSKKTNPIALVLKINKTRIYRRNTDTHTIHSSKINVQNPNENPSLESGENALFQFERFALIYKLNIRTKRTQYTHHTIHFTHS